MLTKFKTQIIIHLLILVALPVIGVWYIAENRLLSSFILFSFLFVITVGSLFRIINRTNRNLANFLLSIQYDDFRTTYTQTTKEASEKALFRAFNLISGKFNNIRLEKEIQFQYFHNLMEEVATGLIGFDQNGQTIFMNRALQGMLHKSYFPSFTSFAAYDPALHQLLTSLRPGQSKLFEKSFLQENIQVSVRLTQLDIKGKRFEFYSFLDIRPELAKHETESWQKLIRIMTHEIMNSITPVVSLAHSVNDLLSHEKTFTTERQEEVQKAVEAIQKRSEGLMHFTSTYRQLTKIPQPVLQDLNTTDLLDRVCLLLYADMQAHHIHLEKKYGQHQQNIHFQGDPDLLEQAFINLLKNAIEALSNIGGGRILLAAESLENKVQFRFIDTGPGIPADVLQQIFIPFFSTKKQGSGIGLSLSRQIIQMHNGSLQVFSQEGEGAEFVIRIPLRGEE